MNLSLKDDDRKKRAIGLIGEGTCALKLYNKGWQVYQPYVDEQIDLIAMRYYCTQCKDFTSLLKRPKQDARGKSGRGKMLTDRCAKCDRKSVIFVERFLQIKTSYGKPTGHAKKLKYSFHTNLRYNVDPRTFYVWMAAGGENPEENPVFHYYIFHHQDINRFDNLELHSHQKSDNQKKELTIDIHTGKVLNKGRMHDYSCFGEFLNNFDVLKKIRPADLETR